MASPYAVKEGEKCLACGMPRTAREHLAHTPRNRWPDSKGDVPHKARVVIAGKVYDADKVPDESAMLRAMLGNVPIVMPPDPFAEAACECGYVVPEGKEPVSALRMHRRMAKVHKGA